MSLENMIEAVADAYVTAPYWIDTAAKYVGYASFAAAVTPWNWDNKLIGFLGKVVNLLALNIRNAKNIAPKIEKLGVRLND
jgi:hypothetical protein